ncbi:TonB-dependent receptor [Pontibacter harenae]|uniref:TonB-dependent receptor n=1 Tax=Pontibacter harenae TaxID=2894083 RepID=UPI001E53FBF6|nr:carboxypeptidase regulatory-like domain-containing protein [Pontibacter harenae]MCC9169099.1 carboxypeptidase regulatory-like domain-containing protein [Pontibacter harenae]
MKNFYRKLCLLLAMVLWIQLSWAQGVTTSSMTGVVTDQTGEGLPGATVEAIHTPSGTTYGTATLEDGRFTIPNMRVGGPYQVTIKYIGFQDKVHNNISLSLGTAYSLNVRLVQQSSELSEVQVISDRNAVISSERAGTATNISREAITSLPTISRSINDFTRLTPQASGTSFGGQDNRLNNITIDGSILNSSFGLSGQPGGRTGTAPISLDAIEQVQVNMAPYDVRQGGFTGAGINAVTRSGTNEFSGSIFYNIQNEKFLGSEAKGREVASGNFNNTQAGFRLGGPILKNKLFFFINGEIERRTEPATTYRANRGNEEVAGNVTRVLESDLNELSSFLRDRFDYETGPYQGYDNQTRSNKILAKLDYNISNNHRASIRYNMLDSERDALTSNSSSLGFGSRRTNLNALNYQNSNYIQFEKIHSVIGELNSSFGTKFSNNLIVGYTYQNEDRGSRGDFFPLIEIQNEGRSYITAGFEPFTPNNRLSYSTFQFQNNFSYYAGAHTLTAGVNVERLSFENVFFPGSQSVYVYNSLEDFYTAANGYLADPNLETSPVELRRFQLRYSALPGGAEPIQPTRVTYSGLYIQDSWAAMRNLTVTAGLRADVSAFDETGFYNPDVAEMTFRDADGNPLQVNTAELPGTNILWSPRLGFNWDVLDDQTLQVRGGSGIFSGRPPFVWISNQIGNNGVLTGFTQNDRTTNYPFNPDPTAYIPDNPELPSSYEINVSDRNFKFPQVWRSNLAVDKSLFAGIVGTVEFIYSKNINSANYININQAAPTSTFNGPDNRLMYPGYGLGGDDFNEADRINPSITSAPYLTNTDKGYSYSFTAQLQKPFSNGFFALLAYNFGEAKDLISAGSTAGGSYNGIRSVNGNNYPELAFSNNDQRHRVIGSVSYRKEYAGFGATQISIFSEARTQNRFSYTYNGDMNGDGIFGNDLLFVPNRGSDLNFLPITGRDADGNTVTLYTPEQQAAAFDAYIAQDEYLSSRRGQYAERNGAIMPWVYQTDLSLVQEFFVNVAGKRNTLQLRGDIFNVGNMINSNWGVYNRVLQTSPLTAAGVNAAGVPQYRLQTLNGQPIANTFDTSAGINDVWRAQIGVRYIFN